MSTLTAISCLIGLEQDTSKADVVQSVNPYLLDAGLQSHHTTRVGIRSVRTLAVREKEKQKRVSYLVPATTPTTLRLRFVILTHGTVLDSFYNDNG